MRTAMLTAVRHTIRAIADRLARTVAAVVVALRSFLRQGRLLHHWYQPTRKRGPMPHAWSESAWAWMSGLGLGGCALRLAECRLPRRAGKGGARPGMPGQCR